MAKVDNPLLDKRRKKQNEMTASDDNHTMEGDGPISPVSNRRMKRASCNGIPVWIDAPARLILPVKKGM